MALLHDGEWTCPACTYVNAPDASSDRTCEICEQPCPVDEKDPSRWNCDACTYSNAPEDTVYPSAEETLASLDLDPRQWRGLCVCAIAGMGTRDEVQGETVKDNVIFLERIG